MNRVYKVIWSKAKHCYVVTSEIARSVTKSASSARSAGRKGAAVLAMAALLFTAGGVLGEVAANVTDVKQGSTADVIMVTKDGNTDKIIINDVYHAMKANSDGDGLVIKENYAKKTDAKDNLKVGDDGVISKVTGNDGTTSSPVNKLVLKVDGDNQITMDEKGIKVGTNGTVIGSNGSIKGANGDFEVDEDGKVTAKGGVETGGAEIKTGGGSITAGKITGTELNTQGGAITGGMATVTGLTTQGGDISGGDITATSLNTQNGEINGGDIKSSGTIHAKGKITGNGLDAGSGAVEGNSLTLKGGDLDAGSGTITTKGNIKADGTITTKNLEVTDGFKTDHMTLGSKPLNYTKIDMGNVTSKVNENVSGVEYIAESIFNKDGSSITVRTNEGKVDSTGSSTVGSQIITQYLGNNAVPGGNNVTRKMIRNNDGTFSMEDKAVYDGKSSTVSQNAKEGIVSETNGGAGSKVTLTQGMNGTYKVETSGTSIEEISGQKIENYKGGLDTNITGNETHDVSGNMTTTVTGDSSLTAENITNEAKNKITNKAIDVETDATSSIVQKVTNDAGSNTSTQWSYQTKEEMSQTDGKTASYLRGAVEEKSELIDGDVKTTIDTIAGQTNTNITDGTNTSNDLQKADQIASSVTDGTNTTVVNQNARSLASSITDGPTKFNNSIHWVGGSEQRIEVDDTHFYAEIRTAEKAEEALKSGNTVIDIVKDTTTATVSSAVFDGATITGISQNAKDISLSAAGGTIASGAKNISNTAAEKLSNSAADIENKASKSILNQVGENTSWKMMDGTVVESVKDASGKTNQTTTTAADTYQFVKDGDNTLAKRTSSTNDNLNITDDTNTYTKITTATSNKQTVTDGTETASTNLTKEASNTLIKNGTQSVLNHIAADTSYTVMNENGNGSRRQQTASEILDRVTDGTDTSEVKQTASEVAASAKNISNTATDKITNITGDNTVTSDTNGTTFANEKAKTPFEEGDERGTKDNTKITGNKVETGKVLTDFAEVANNLDVKGSTTLGRDGNTNLTVNSKSEFKDTVKMDSTLEVNGTSTLTGDVTMESNATVTKDLTVKGASEFVGRADFRYDVFMDENLTVAKETRTDTLYVDHDGYVGGNLNVEGNIETHDAVLSADSRQVVTGRQLYQTNERVDRLDNRIKKVGANAAALAALRPGDFNPDDKFSIAAGFGSYRNANAAALGLFYRPNENVLLSLGTSFGDGENMVNAGVSVKFGRGKSMAERRKEMADEVSSMRDEMRSQDERIAELEEMLKKQSELIEKLSKES